MKRYSRLTWAVVILLALVALITACTGDVGPAGAKGDKGDRGAQGLTGEKGDKGDTGPEGVAGEKGDTGPTSFATIALASSFFLEAGGNIGVLGSGFEPGEGVTIVVLAPGRNVSLGGAIANDVGSFYETFEMKKARTISGEQQGLPAGTYTVQAKGSSGSQATAPLVVAAEFK